MGTSSRVSTLLLLGASLLPSSAFAQDAPDAVAEALFQDGRALMAQRRYPEACAKLAESQRLDPHIGTLLNVAACRALEGRTATAWAAYAEARSQAVRAGRADHEAFATEQLRQLEPRLARVRITAAVAPPGLVLALDGQAMEAGALGTALPVDPGAHTLTASAPARAGWSTHFDASEATARDLVVPPLAPVASPMPGPAPAPAPADTTTGPGPLLLGLGSVAAAGLGTGAVFGVLAFVRNGNANAACPGGACSAAGLQADSDARTDATVSDVAFAVGGAAAAVALLYWALGPRSNGTRAAVTPASVGLRATW